MSYRGRRWNRRAMLGHVARPPLPPDFFDISGGNRFLYNLSHGAD
jgi:hypothetical protein